jgi:hypothetical protein
MSRHLVEWLLENPIDLPEVPNVGTDRAWRVLMALANRADENTGKMYASDRTQERDTGLERRGVIQPVRKALEDAGWLVNTGKVASRGVKVYELVVPGYSRPSSSGEVSLATEVVDNKPSGVASGEGSGVGSGEVSLAQTEQNETPPLTPQKGARSQAPKGGQDLEQLLAMSVALEVKHYAGTAGVGLQKMWRKEYTPIAVKALEGRQGETLEQLAQQCYESRNGITPRKAPPVAPETPQGSPGCELCEGKGWRNVLNAEGNWQSSDCDCTKATQVPTNKRVTTDESANTYIPTPGGTADPQSVIRELTRRLNRAG